MEFNAYQNFASTTRIYPENMKIIYPCLGLSGEVGEVCEKVKKIYRDKKGNFSEHDKEQIVREMGKYGMWVNMAWYLHEKELGLNNKEQDIFMDKKIKALFFDIDGTLVSFKSHRIPQSTVDALEQAKENGVEVYISTGRPKQIINNLGQIEHLIDGYITANGARCFVEDTLVSQHAILPSDVKKIIEAADRDNFTCNSSLRKSHSC